MTGLAAPILHTPLKKLMNSTVKVLTEKKKKEKIGPPMTWTPTRESHTPEDFTLRLLVSGHTFS